MDVMNENAASPSHVVKRWTIMPNGIPKDLFTSTGKLRRNQFAEKYVNVIEKLYGSTK